MNQYVYYDNAKGQQTSQGWLAPVLFECMAETISDADDLMIAKTGVDPRKNKYIGCQVFSDFPSSTLRSM